MRKLLSILIFACALNASAQNIAINTDVLVDGACAAPSFGVEVGISKRSTLGLNAAYSPNLAWSFGKAFIVQPEYRFYFSGRPMYRHFIGLVAMYTDYKLHIRSHHYEGNAAGLGVSFGYVWNIKQRWAIDFHSSLGAAFFNQKEWSDGGFDMNYVSDSERDLGYVPANNHGTICMPIRLGISVVYLIK